ncbi:MAG: DUF4190 domain-containing protein [Flavobacteriaceae bacterium]|nr:DUF4190 domain-containing protein [Flavobacteriaceae bacterium]
MEKQKLPNSTLVLVMGILSIVGCCCYGAPGIVFGIIALIMAKKATNLYNEAPENYEGYGNVKTGKIMGLIGLIFSILFIAYLVWVISFIGWEVLQNPELLQEKIKDLSNQ